MIRNKNIASFTLVEVLVVISIIVMLAGLTVGASRYASYAGKANRAKAEIAAIELAAESFKLDNGEFPPCEGTDFVANGVSLYTNLSMGTKVYLELKKIQVGGGGDEQFILDPWGQPYRYSSSTNETENPNAPGGMSVYSTAGKGDATNAWIANFSVED